MRPTGLACGMLLTWLACPAFAAAADAPADELAGLKREVEVAWRGLDLPPDRATEADRKAATELYREQAGDLARRALALAEAHPDAPAAAEALAWIHDGGLGGYGGGMDAQLDAAYDLMARGHAASDAILPVVRIAWSDAASTTHAESFLRTLAERSANPRVRGLACLSLGRLQQRLASLARGLDDPERVKLWETFWTPETFRRVRAVRPAAARREAEELYERVVRDFAPLEPLGRAFPPLGVQAEGMLYRLRNLDIGCVAPELAGHDLAGRPIRLADFRGKVVVISFWATWCGPCMAMVPAEKALVERMQGRPFALVGINGDDDRAAAQAGAAGAGISWPSFWDGGRLGPISVRWGVSQWPTIYLVDAKGVIRAENLRGEPLDRAVAALVAEAEAGR